MIPPTLQTPPALTAPAPMVDQEAPRGRALLGLPLPPGRESGRSTPPQLNPPRTPEMVWVESILTQRPEHGEARLAQLEWALAWNGGRSFPTPNSRPNPRYPGQPSLSALEAWRALRKIPDWPWQVDLQSPSLGPTLLRAVGYDLEPAASELIQALATDPANPRLQSNLAFLHFYLQNRDQLDRRCTEWEAITPLPGQLWPPLPLIRAHLDALLRLERFTEVQGKANAWSRPASRVFLTRDAWQQRSYREALLVTYARIAATSAPDDLRTIRESLEDIRAVAGSDYANLAGFYRSRIKITDRDIGVEVDRLIARPALPPPPMPAPLPPWRLLFLQASELVSFRAAFNEDRNLQTWLPSERNLALAPDQPGPLEVWLGDQKVWAGEILPNLDTLSGLLSEGRRGRLRMATDQVEQAPDHPGRRRFRVPLLLERMPLKALEETLAEDLGRTLCASVLKEEPQDENLWFYAAQRVVPNLEAHLDRWPLDGERWEAFAFWSGFLPNHPGPGPFANAQPAWQAGLPFRLGLAPATHARVGAQLARQKAWAKARAWFEPAWEELRSLKAGDWVRWPWLKQLEPELRHGLDQAYRGLNQEGLRRLLRESHLGPGRPGEP